MSESTASTAGAAPRARTPLKHPDHSSAADPVDAPTLAEFVNDAPRTEAWVRVVFGALVPAIAALYAPRGLQLALFAVTGAMFLTGLVMLIRQERGRTAPRRD